MTIDTRNELVNALREASEIEHGLLVQYLFAALTLKKYESEGITPEQQALLREWEQNILRIAVDEMGHLGSVCNLLSAVGSEPCFDRPNFPQSQGYYPFSFDLVPFSDETCRRFQIFELPRGFALPPESMGAPAFFNLDAGLLAANVPDPINYEFVGELYSKIRHGFEAIPERELFVGPPAAQVPNEWSVSLDMRQIRTRGEALAAIDDIIVDGEGAPLGNPSSHYGRFTAMRQAYFEAGQFDAARPVVRNPAIRAQRDVDADAGATILTNELAIEVAGLFSGVYTLMLTMLHQFFTFAGESEFQRKTLKDAAARSMSVAIRPLSEVLSSLPAHADGDDNQRAGPTFELFEQIALPPHPPARWTLLLERFDVVVDDCARLSADVPRLALIGDTLAYMRRSIADAAAEV